MARNLKCEVCGGDFECLGADCWCTEVEVNPGRKEHISLVAADCVCPNCLTGRGTAKPLEA